MKIFHYHLGRVYDGSVPSAEVRGPKDLDQPADEIWTNQHRALGLIGIKHGAGALCDTVWDLGVSVLALEGG